MKKERIEILVSRLAKLQAHIESRNNLGLVLDERLMFIGMAIIHELFQIKFGLLPSFPKGSVVNKSEFNEPIMPRYRPIESEGKLIYSAKKHLN